MADFQKWSSRFKSEQVKVIAGSTDPLETVRDTVIQVGITFPVAHSLNAVEFSEKTGAFYDGHKMFLNSTGFLIRPDNSIEVACYSSSHVGRFTARDLFGLIRYFKKQKEAPLRTVW